MLETTSDRETMEAPVASAIVLRRGRETLRVEPWGRNSVRVRVALGPLHDDGLGSLLPMPAPAGTETAERGGAQLVVDGLTVSLDEDGRLRISRTSDGARP